MMRKFLTVLLLAVIAGMAYSQTGVIRELTGEVELKTAGSQAFTPAAAGMEVAQNTIVSTGLRSTAVIAIGSNTITVRPLTRLSLAEIQTSAGTENLSVNLQTGRVRVEVKPPAGSRANTTVQTPTATASVRGTEFEMDSNSVYVGEGTVIVQGKDGLGVPITQGNSTTVTGDSALTQNESFMQSLTPDAPVGAGIAGGAGSASALTSNGEIEIEIVW